MFCMFSTLVGCTSKKENRISGIWQHPNDKGMTIEFDKDGSYYLLDSNKRIVFEDSTVFKYSYKPEINQGFNFILKDNMTDYQCKGNITFNNPDNIYLSIKGSDQLSIQREYIRVKN